MTSSADLLLKGQTLDDLVAALQNSPTNQALVNAYFSSFCDCNMVTWIIQQIRANNTTVINTIRALIAAPAGHSVVSTTSKPPQGTLVSEFCQGVDLWANIADGNGGVVATKTYVNSFKCGALPVSFEWLYGGTSNGPNLSEEAFNYNTKMGGNVGYGNTGGGISGLVVYPGIAADGQISGGVDTGTAQTQTQIPFGGVNIPFFIRDTDPIAQSTGNTNVGKVSFQLVMLNDDGSVKYVSVLNNSNLAGRESQVGYQADTGYGVVYVDYSEYAAGTFNKVHFVEGNHWTLGLVMKYDGVAVGSCKILVGTPIDGYVNLKWMAKSDFIPVIPSGL